MMMDWIIESFTDSRDKWSYSFLAELIKLIFFQALAFVVFLAGAKRYLNSLCPNNPGYEDLLPFLKYPVQFLDYLDSVEASGILVLKRILGLFRVFLLRCLRKLRSSLFNALSDISQNLDPPAPPSLRQDSEETLPSPGAAGEDRPRIVQDRPRDRTKVVILRVPGDQATRGMSIGDGNIADILRVSRPVTRSTSNRNTSASTEGSSGDNNDTSPLSLDWYGHYIRQRKEALVPEDVERYGRPRTVLQESNVPRNVTLLKSTTYYPRPVRSAVN